MIPSAIYLTCSYSGPGSQLVTSEWKFDFNTFLSSGLGYVVLEADGAGSFGQGQVRSNGIQVL